MIRPRKLGTRPAVEALEDRCMPAGNVMAQVAPFDSALLIVGDNEGNEIRVIEYGPGHVRMEGLGSTTVNGKAADELFSSTRFVVADIQLGNGGDFLIYEVKGAQRIDTLIDTGVGDDSVTVLASGLVGGLLLDTGVGSDNVTIDLAPATMLVALQLNTGVGDDTVLFEAHSDGGMPIVMGSLPSVIDTAQGNDVVHFEGRFLARLDLLVFLGEGDDTLIGDPDNVLPAGTVTILGELGHDTVLNGSYFNGGLFLFETID